MGLAGRDADVPLVGGGLHDVRISLKNRIVRVFFYIDAAEEMVLLHAIVKKTNAVPDDELAPARQRMDRHKASAKAVRKTKGDFTVKQAKARRVRNKATGSSFDSFLAEKGILEEVHARAIKEVVAWQLDRRRRELKLTKRAMAERLKTSRTQIERLLDPTNDHVQLDTLQKAARLVGREIRIDLVEPTRAKRAA
jgi:hypothetical protein